MLVFVLLCITCHFKACNYLNEEERAGCFALIFLMSFYFSFYVALPHCAIGWSAVCYCDHLTRVESYSNVLTNVSRRLIE